MSESLTHSINQSINQIVGRSVHSGSSGTMKEGLKADTLKPHA